MNIFDYLLQLNWRRTRNNYERKYLENSFPMNDIIRRKLVNRQSLVFNINQIKEIFNALLEIIYPPACAVCQTFLKADEKILICDKCLDAFHEIHPPFCKICRTPFSSQREENHRCENCIRERPRYRQLLAPYQYEGRLMDAIHNFKYAGKRYLGKSLGKLLASYARKWLKDMAPFLIIPVPLYSGKVRERGFNQSLILAREVSIRLGTELDFLSLRRIRHTSPQTGLKRPERRSNVRNAFEFRGRSDIRGRNILLVDDVATTGSTLNECAKQLIKNGSGDVFCLVLARTS